MDDRIREAATREVPWDEVRERRVLEAVRAQVDSAGRSRWPALGIGLGLAGAAAAAIVFLFVLEADQPSKTDLSAESGEGVVAKEPERPQTPVPPPSERIVQIAESSRAVLSADAEVEILERSDSRLLIAQERGEVRYEVEPSVQQQVTLVAASVEIEVFTSQFVTTIEDDELEVEVSRGRVRVRDGERIVDLKAGESIRVRRTPEPVEPVDVREQPTEAASIEELLARADSARKDGRSKEAIVALRELVRNFPEDPRAVSTWFTIGKLERARSKHRDAARAFARTWRSSPRGPLAEDALAEEALSWHRAGRSKKASVAVARYRERYPMGVHLDRLAEIADDLPE